MKTLSKEALEVLSQIFNAATAKMFVVDKDTRFLLANEATAKDFGLTVKQLIGKTTFDVFPEVIAKKLQKETLDLIGSGKPTKIEQKFNFDGTTRFELVHRFPFSFSSEGPKEYMACIVADVTQSRINEADLQEAQSIAKIGSWRKSLLTNELSFSNEFYQLLEIEKNEPIEKVQQLYRSKIHPEDALRLEKLMERALNHGEDFVFEHRLLLDGGKKVKQIRAICKVIKENGKPVQIYGTSQDLTEEWALRKSLSESNEQLEIFKAVIENSSDFIGIADNNLVPIYCNPAGRKMVGIPLDLDISTVNIPDCYPEEIRSTTVNEIINGMMTNGNWQGETVFRHFVTNKKIPVLDTHFNIFHSKTGEPIGHATITRDISKQKELLREVELERSKSIQSAKLASLGEMSGGIAHEINNPLAIIIGNLNLLKKNKGDSQKLEARLEATLRAAERIEKIVKGLQKFARIEQVLPKQKQLIKEIVDEAILFTESAAMRFQTQISAKIPSDLELVCEPVEITQILVNLLKNGIYAFKNKETRWVKIIAFKENNQLVLQVQDSGSGISPEVEQKLFQPFFTTKPVGEGTGLGLSIAKGILDQHNASISLNHAYKNTCFEMRFPIPSQNSPAKQAA